MLRPCRCLNFDFHPLIAVLQCVAMAGEGGPQDFQELEFTGTLGADGSDGSGINAGQVFAMFQRLTENTQSATNAAVHAVQQMQAFVASSF